MQKANITIRITGKITVITVILRRDRSNKESLRVRLPKIT